MSTNISSNSSLQTYEYDRQKELQNFDNTKLGVKGLVNSGITRIPSIFHHPPDTLFDPKQAVLDDDHRLIPVIDMVTPHHQLVDQIRDASSKSGYFQVVNHGVPVELLDRLLEAVKAFHDLSSVEEKVQYYRRIPANSATGVGFYSNFDLFQSKAASWRDTLEVRSGPTVVDPNHIPPVCRDEMMEWDTEVKLLAERIMELLSEGLGLNAERLKEISCFERRVMVAQCYPYCPEPNKTVGITSHTDLESLTVLLQDQIGGLQVKYLEKWVNVKPVPGALVISIGDTLQMISNGAYKSGEHRVYANSLRETRVSIAVFFDPGASSENVYGPLHELVSPEKPALYPQFKYWDVLNSGWTTGLEGEGKYTINHFQL